MVSVQKISARECWALCPVALAVKEVLVAGFPLALTLPYHYYQTGSWGLYRDKELASRPHSALLTQEWQAWDQGVDPWETEPQGSVP